jgi:hypothetical protein
VSAMHARSGNKATGAYVQGLQPMVVAADDADANYQSIVYVQIYGDNRLSRSTEREWEARPVLDGS